MEARELSLPRRVPIKALLMGAGIAIAFMVLGREPLEAARFALESLWLISPYVAAGLFVTAMLTATGSAGIIATAFEGRELTAIVFVSFIGALIPVCGITVLPLVAGLLAAGVPLAPIMAFLLSSPITSPEYMVVTAGMLGWPFAIGKTVAAFAIGIAGGIATLALVRTGFLGRPVRNSKLLDQLSGGDCACPAANTVRWRFWEEPDRRQLFNQTLISVGKLMLIWLSLAFIAEYFVRAYLPPELLVGLVGSGSAWAVPIAATIGAPIYLDGYAALPLVRGLIDRGMGEGAAMAFLIAGGITSVWAAIPVFALVRLPVFAWYISSAVVGSMLAGWAYGFMVG